MPYGSEVELEIGKEYCANIEYEIYEDLEIEVVQEQLKSIECIEESFMYSVIGILRIDDIKIESIIEISLDPDDLYDCGCYDNKYIKFKIDRFNIDFRYEVL